MRYSDPFAIDTLCDAQRIYEELPDKTDEAGSRWLWMYDQLGGTAYAARQFRERGGEVTFDAWNHIDFVEGHQIQMPNVDAVEVQRLQ